ncbi:MAG: hypothetical protein EBZ69_00265 [Alphaproteobacteria bacterium]|nr:hypothetical protein [Alphaproteobacteria bacterium]
MLEWCRNLVRAASQDAVWGIPRSGTTFKIDKKNKTLVLIIAGFDDDADFLATQRVFSFIGWDVIKKASNEQPTPD